MTAATKTTFRCRCNRSQGFTLIELMVVVLIVGIVMALAAPTITTAMQNRTGAEAAYRILGVYKVARTRAMMRGFAHRVAFTPGPGGVGRFEVWESDRGSSCKLTGWAGLPLTQRVLVLDLNESDFLSNDVRVDAFTPSGGGGADICYTPLGQMWYSASGGASWDDGSGVVGGGFDISINRYEGAVLSGPTRHVVLPIGGMPRLRI